MNFIISILGNITGLLIFVTLKKFRVIKKNLEKNEKVSIEELKNNLIKKLNDNVGDLDQFKREIELLEIILK